MQNRRKTIVINRRFQYQYSLLIVSLAVILINFFLIARLATGGAPLILDSGTFVGVAIIELFLVAGIWYGSLVTSHRIAGPVHVFNREIMRLGEGQLVPNIALRDKDMFHAEARDINNSIGALREKIEAVKQTAAELSAAQTAGTDTAPLIARLNQHLDALKTR